MFAKTTHLRIAFLNRAIAFGREAARQNVDVRRRLQSFQNTIDRLKSNKIYEVAISIEQVARESPLTWALENCPSYVDHSVERIGLQRSQVIMYRFTDLGEATEFKLCWL